MQTFTALQIDGIVETIQRYVSHCRLHTAGITMHSCYCMASTATHVHYAALIPRLQNHLALHAGI